MTKNETYAFRKQSVSYAALSVLTQAVCSQLAHFLSARLQYVTNLRMYAPSSGALH